MVFCYFFPPFFLFFVFLCLFHILLHLFCRNGKLPNEKQAVTANLCLHAISMFVCSNSSQKLASMRIVEAMFYIGVTKRSVLLWEGLVALTFVKRDERERV